MVRHDYIFADCYGFVNMRDVLYRMFYDLPISDIKITADYIMPISHIVTLNCHQKDIHGVN